MAGNVSLGGEGFLGAEGFLGGEGFLSGEECQGGEGCVGVFLVKVGCFVADFCLVLVGCVGGDGL